MRNIGRRAFLSQLLALTAVCATGGGKIAYGGSVASLLDAERLKFELRVTSDAQAAYVDDVVDKVMNMKDIAAREDSWDACFKFIVD